MCGAFVCVSISVSAPLQVPCVLWVQAEVCVYDLFFMCVCWGWGGTPERHLFSVMWPSTDTVNHWTGGTWGTHTRTHTQMAAALVRAALRILADTHTHSFVSHAEWHIDTILTAGQSANVTHAWWNEWMEWQMSCGRVAQAERGVDLLTLD